MTYFDMLLDHEYELVKSPAGAKQWQPIGQKAEDPGSRRVGRRASKVPTMMTTADMATEARPRIPQGHGAVPQRPGLAFGDAFARAWFKLCHRDMGPKVRYLGPEVPPRT
jgi:catalase-peroxidase